MVNGHPLYTVNVRADAAATKAKSVVRDFIVEVDVSYDSTRTSLSIKPSCNASFYRYS